jgi:hypothetical protein
MIPTALFLTLYWWRVHAWLQSVGDGESITARVVPWLGLVAGIFLIVYSSVLGSIGEVYQLQRRIGVTIFFAATFLAQLLLTNRLSCIRKRQHPLISGPIYSTLLVLCILMLGLGLVNVLMSLINIDADNVIEWNFALAMNIYFVVTYFLWRGSGHRLRK